ncbi:MULTISPECIES: hypothetical protein [unclassified Isoptericola]
MRFTTRPRRARATRGALIASLALTALPQAAGAAPDPAGRAGCVPVASTN